MVEVVIRNYLVSDWINEPQIVEGQTEYEAASRYLEHLFPESRHVIVPTLDTNNSIVFAHKLTSEVEDTILTISDLHGRSEALARLNSTMHFVEGNA